MSKPGISILLRAGNNKEAAKKFLDHFIKVNDYQPVEVIVLFNNPEKKHIQLIRDYTGKAFVKVFPAKGRVFSRVESYISYNTVLIASTPFLYSRDILSNAITKFAENKSSTYTKPAKNVILLNKSLVRYLNNSNLDASADQLAKVLNSKSSDIQQGVKESKELSQPIFKSKNNEIEAGNSTSKSSSKAISSKKNQEDNDALDIKIKSLEKDIESLDIDLTHQYKDIEILDNQYDDMIKNNNEAKISEQKKVLKEKVYKANQSLKELKTKHDDLERLRIRRYSILN